MRLYLDAHVHIYPVYSVSRLLESAFSFFGTYSEPGDVWGLCLTERFDCHMFATLKAQCGERGIYRIEATGEAEALRIGCRDAFSLFLFAGRQIVTRERLEVLALTSDGRFDERKPLNETIEAVREASAVPVIAWSPGKWFLDRGAAVKRCLSKLEPGSARLGDTSLRFVGWPSPPLFRYGRRRGIHVLAGSDPLPYPGEERYVGSYGSVLEGPFDPDRPVSSLRALLLGGTRPAFFGRRNGIRESLGRLRRHMQNHQLGKKSR